MVAVFVGPLAVPCPTCRAVAGRRCVVPRGYFYEGGSHARRREAWMQAEADEFAALPGSA